ncbi:MAG: hypothetical protein A2W26_04280 [Acidobacteria bacterium RBG_16_64_8]|nr:MAG: hypothetical protein A2W26_04280 [Acidobacteria bacterium RBG_16_64_8]
MSDDTRALDGSETLAALIRTVPFFHTLERVSCARLMPDSVAFTADDDVVPGAGQNPKGDLVGHCARWEPERRFLIQKRSNLILQTIDGGILTDWSSPTGAAAMAARISGEGRVTVSERRSIISSITCPFSEKCVLRAPYGMTEAG